MASEGLKPKVVVVKYFTHPGSAIQVSTSMESSMAFLKCTVFLLIYEAKCQLKCDVLV